MSFNQFTNLDFNDLRTQIKDYLRSNSNFTDFDFEGSNFSVLIDILAYNSYITAYNTNMQANEAFLDSAIKELNQGKGRIDAEYEKLQAPEDLLQNKNKNKRN